MKYPEKVVKIAKIMEKYGYRAYAVGGCVRDTLMGKTPSDWDMTTDASPEKMIEIFALEGIRTIPTGLKHGTVTVLLDGEGFELTTFRVDGSYTDSRHPDQVTFTRNIEDDLARRDFTVNAIAAYPLSKKDGEIIDIFGGREDIHEKTIRAVGDPRRRFEEDALRILRAVRFAATLSFEIEENTKQAAKALACGLQKVSIERKIVELKKMLTSNGADRGLDLLFELGLEKYIHKDIKKPRFSLLTLPERFETRMAALFCENESVPDLSSLKLSRAEVSGIKKLCDKRAFCGELTEKNARRMIFEYGELAFDAAILNQNIALAEIIREQSKNSPCVSIAQLKVSGNDLISAGIEPKQIGAIMSRLLDRMIEEPSLNEKDTLIALAREVGL